MREIKFRGKRVDNGEWVFGSFIPDALEGSDSDLVSWGFIRRYNRDVRKMETIEVDRETVGQYTGLDDKNGVKIFEGDIVREYANDYTPIYQNGIYMAYNVDKINDPYVSTQFNVIWRNGCEVIGSIHDNPKLMGEKK